MMTTTAGWKRCDYVDFNFVGIRSTTATRLRSSASSTDADYASTTTAASTVSTATSFLEEARTLLRVLLPASISGMFATCAFPSLCRTITEFVVRTTSAELLGTLGDATSSFVGLVGLLYSILVGQVFGFLYGQQEVSGSSGGGWWGGGGGRGGGRGGGGGGPPFCVYSLDEFLLRYYDDKLRNPMPLCERDGHCERRNRKRERRQRR
jgi:hypothetical protein